MPRKEVGGMNTNCAPFLGDLRVNRNFCKNKQTREFAQEASSVSIK